MSFLHLPVPSYLRWWCKDMMSHAMAATLGREVTSMRTKRAGGDHRREEGYEESVFLKWHTL